MVDGIPKPAPDDRPPVSRWEGWRLRRRLRRAARLLRREAIQDQHYAAIAYQVVSRLKGDIAAGESLKGRRFGVFTPVDDHVFEILLRKHSGRDPDATRALQESFERYGPWNAVSGMLPDELMLPRGAGDAICYEWNDEAEQLLEEAGLRLKARHRLKFANEKRMDRNRRHFPHTTDLFVRVGLLLLGALVGYLLGKL